MVRKMSGLNGSATNVTRNFFGRIAFNSGSILRIIVFIIKFNSLRVIIGERDERIFGRIKFIEGIKLIDI